MCSTESKVRDVLKLYVNKEHPIYIYGKLSRIKIVSQRDILVRPLICQKN